MSRMITVGDSETILGEDNAAAAAGKGKGAVVIPQLFRAFIIGWAV